MPRVSYTITKRGGESVRHCAEQARQLFLEEWKPLHWHLEDVQEAHSAHAGNMVRVEFAFQPDNDWTSVDMHRSGILDDGD